MLGAKTERLPPEIGVGPDRAAVLVGTVSRLSDDWRVLARHGWAVALARRWKKDDYVLEPVR